MREVATFCPHHAELLLYQLPLSLIEVLSAAPSFWPQHGAVPRNSAQAVAPCRPCSSLRLKLASARALASFESDIIRCLRSVILFNVDRD
jgi:hypothetical protein